MKNTLNVNIGSVPFTIDEDAYDTLKRYFADIRSRLDDHEVREVLADVEARTAEIFRENIVYPSQVVGVQLVRLAITTIGSAESFGAKRYDAPPATECGCGNAPRKLYRSRTNRTLGGVCGGLAEYFNIDVSLMRVITVILALISFGTVLLVYLILCIVIPTEPVHSDYFNRTDRK